jgi:hypothetical protein
MARADMNIRLSIEGLKEVQDAIKKIPLDMESKVYRNATVKAFAPVAKRAKANMKLISPTIAKAIGVKTKAYKSAIVTLVGIKIGTTATVTKKTIEMPDGTTREVTRKHNPINTAHLVELGTAAHQVKIPWLNITAQHPGTKAYRPMGKALESEKDNVIRIFTKQIITGMDQIVAKQRKKAARGART